MKSARSSLASCSCSARMSVWLASGLSGWPAKELRLVNAPNGVEPLTGGQTPVRLLGEAAGRGGESLGRGSTADLACATACEEAARRSPRAASRARALAMALLNSSGRPDGRAQRTMAVLQAKMAAVLEERGEMGGIRSLSRSPASARSARASTCSARSFSAVADWRAVRAILDGAGRFGRTKVCKLRQQALRLPPGRLDFLEGASTLRDIPSERIGPFTRLIGKGQGKALDGLQGFGNVWRPLRGAARFRQIGKTSTKISLRVFEPALLLIPRRVGGLTILPVRSE